MEEEDALTEEPLWIPPPPPPLNLDVEGPAPGGSLGDDGEDADEGEDIIEEYSSEDLLELVEPADRRIFPADFGRHPRHLRRHHHQHHRRWHPQVYISVVCSSSHIHSRP